MVKLVQLRYRSRACKPKLIILIDFPKSANHDNILISVHKLQRKIQMKGLEAKGPFLQFDPS